MAVANLFTVPKSPEEEKWWSFSHMAHHRDLIRTANATYSTNLPEYAIDPFGEAVADIHQEMHNDLDALVGGQGYDLTEINWKDPAQRASWVYLNATWHQQKSQILGVG